MTTALRVLAGATGLLLAAVLNGCIVRSIYENDKSVDPNYGFEREAKTLPLSSTERRLEDGLETSP